MLRNLELKTNYSSESDNLYFDFFLPALSEARVYRRAVGYFSLGVLLNTPAAMSRIAGSDGRIELIFGQLVSHADFEALQAGLGQLPIGSDFPSFEELIAQHQGTLIEYRTRLLAWLFGSGRLEMKMAVRPEGLFHQKVGLLEDGFDDAVSFTGSMNETMSALDPRYNSEEIAVFKSWQAGQREYVENHRETFARLWSGDTGSSTIICPLPEAIEAGLRMVADRFPERPTPHDEDRKVRAFLGTKFGGAQSKPRVPETLGGKPFKMRVHQLTALRKWSENGNNGILELATGAGKTVTAIYAAVKTIEANDGIALVVAVPYQDLADQWCEELRLFNIHAIKCYGSRDDWEPQIQAYLARTRGDRAEFIAIVVVNRTLATGHFQTYVKQFEQGRLFFIGDECHHHGSEMFVGKLFPEARFRIGLSATPFHYLDEEKNVRLVAVYDRSVFQYGLSEAVDDEVLTPYEYIPVVVELTDTEAQEYADLSSQISRLFAAEKGKKGSAGNERLTGLLMRRARLIGGAERKLPELRALLESQGEVENYSLFYCGDGRTRVERDPDEGADEDEAVSIDKQRFAVAQLLQSRGISVSPFTSDESRWQRREILRRFKTAETTALVAIRCLDEGIDVPACRTAYLIASSRNPRQFVQRRGRILRRAEGKEFAKIFDFVVVLPEGVGVDAGMAGDFLRAELSRVADFARNSLYPASSIKPLLPWLRKYELEHFAV